MDIIRGQFTFSVWQNTTLRDGFVQEWTNPTFLIIALLMEALAVAIWFGVGLGLRPLLDLENAIARRATDDLPPIKGRIPTEVGGIVGLLNTLLGETIAAKDRFTSNAAHQLRNPIAGVLSLAEAVQNPKTLMTSKCEVRIWSMPRVNPPPSQILFWLWNAPVLSHGVGRL